MALKAQYKLINPKFPCGMGNVRAVITDRKFIKDKSLFMAELVTASDSVHCHFEAYQNKVQNLHWRMPISKSLKFGKSELLRIRNRYYYAFGSPLYGRKYTPAAGSYRFGFNTQEKVDEISGEGNHNTAEFWEYDTRLGRRWNVDPVVKLELSGYNCFSGNPIYMVDPNGNDDVTFNQDGTVKSVKERSRLYEFFFGAKGTIVDKDGKVTKKFKFNDKKDAEKKNWIGDDKKFDKLEFWSSDKTIELVKKPLQEVKESIKEDGVLKGSWEAGHDEFDFAMDFKRNTLYVIDDKGYNKYDAGNYMTGVGYRALGWPTLSILMAAQLNSILHANSDNRTNSDYEPKIINFDQPADQRAIREGARFARKNKKKLNGKN